MNPLPRRNFLKLATATAAGLGALPLPSSASQFGTTASAPEFATLAVPLDHWSFGFDPDDRGERDKWFEPKNAGPASATRVTTPHTWQTLRDKADYEGVAWYCGHFDAPVDWRGKQVRIEFEAVYHSAKIWLNGQWVGQHARSGYTAFTFDITGALRFDGRNAIAVRVDNAYDAAMLPRRDSYDWAQDGGIIRPVSLLVSSQNYIERLRIEALPDLDSGRTSLAIRAVVRNASKTAAPLDFQYYVEEVETGDVVINQAGAGKATLEPGAIQAVALTSVEKELKLWHFDHPHLYRAVVEVRQGGQPVHRCSQTFGARQFEVKDTAFYLNGERVRLMGVERMAGSNPAYGMAEPARWIEHDHDDLKELNCVFTRVHWQQDKRVLDYCDRHGILFQEEVPAWGPATFEGMGGQPTAEIVQNGLQQLREMIARDANHPCIVAWGLCNEVNGQNPAARAFIQRLAEEARRLDPHRLLTYASNSLQHTPGEDAAGLLDFIEWNEYYGSWYAGNADSVSQNLQQIHQAFPHQPVVISEYGYCECTPDRKGGDARRIEILREQTEACRQFDFVAGTIFFDYNDYRTHMGDKGVGPFKQRVHGVVDLLGNRKPSFEALREEASPLESVRIDAAEGNAAEGALSATVTARRTLPAYTLEGYTLRWRVFGFDDLPMDEGSAPLPKLLPGEEATLRIEFQEKHPLRVRVDVLRPTGFSAATAWWNAPA